MGRLVRQAPVGRWCARLLGPVGRRRARLLWPVGRRRALLLAASFAAVLCLAATPGAAVAAGNPPGQPAPTGAPAGTATLVSSMTAPPAGYRLTGDQVLATALKNATVREELRIHPKLVDYVYTRGPGTWQVSWFTPVGAHPTQLEMLQLYVSDATDEVTQVWTGYQVAWTMARGYPGAFGLKVNALYVWLPLCVLFLLPFAPIRWRRRRDPLTGRRPSRLRRPTLWHLDLLMLLFFSVSLAFFNNANLGLSVPLVYPSLLYFFVRMLALAVGRGRPREPLRLALPTPWLAVALVFLISFRIGLNVTDSNVIDVGYAGVIGAQKIVDGAKLYGNWPSDNPAGDTYGPVNYYAYVPFLKIFGWSGVWDNLPAAHAAAITFDLLTMVGLFLLGWMVRGPTGGTVLAYLWASFPFTLFVLDSNSNDALVALAVVICLLVVRWAPARGVAGGLAGLTKFAPLALAPLLLRGLGEPPWARPPDPRGTAIPRTQQASSGTASALHPDTASALHPDTGSTFHPDAGSAGGAAIPSSRPVRGFWRRWRRVVWFTVGFAIALVVPMLGVLLSGNFKAFWENSISYQAGRPAPFSLWGLYGGFTQDLRLPEHIWLGCVVALAIASMFLPRGRRTLMQVAALAAAIIIGLQMGITYWFYLYIVWFFPLVITALVLAHPDREPQPQPDPGAGGIPRLELIARA